MTSTSQTALRLDILREAKDQYDAIAKARHSTDVERTLAALKAMECEEMMRELMKDTGDA